MSSKPSNLPKTTDGAMQETKGSGSPYARLFRLKGAKAFCLSAAFARLPMSMMSLESCSRSTICTTTGPWPGR